MLCQRLNIAYSMRLTQLHNIHSLTGSVILRAEHSGSIPSGLTFADYSINLWFYNRAQCRGGSISQSLSTALLPHLHSTNSSDFYCVSLFSIMLVKRILVLLDTQHMYHTHQAVVRPSIQRRMRKKRLIVE